MNVLKSLTLLSIITFFSKILGFMRDSLIAYTFGASGLTDSFFLAFRIPNLFRRIFSEGFFLQTFVPILSEYKKIHNIEHVKKLVSNILGFMVVFLSIFTIFGILFSSQIIFFISPGLKKNFYKLYLTTEILKIIFPYILFISLGSLISSILNSWNYFLIPACSSILLNISIIIFILFFSSYFYVSIFSLAWAFSLGGLIQLIYQILFLKNINMLVFPQCNIKNFKLYKISKRTKIIIFGIIINQISLIINTISSSFLISGSISWIYYADRLTEFVSGILGVSLGTILLPLLSQQSNNKNNKENYKLLDWALRVGCIIAIPSSLSLMILSKVIIIALFQYGNFSIFDVIMTKNILEFYSIGLIPSILTKVMLSQYYSKNDFINPVIISSFILIVTQIMNILFLPILKHNSFACSSSISSWINFVLLYWISIRKKYFFPEYGWLNFLGKIFISVIIMFLVLYLNLVFFSNWHSITIFHKLFQLILICFLSGCSYFLMLFVLGVRLSHFSLFFLKK
ncbi:MAG: murein biosynthesis integral membrane protein MurJ [Buchnera aphidicola (Nurudea yanoniella)]